MACSGFAKIVAMPLIAILLFFLPSNMTRAQQSNVTPDYGDPLVFDAQHNSEVRVKDPKNPGGRDATLLGRHVGEIQMRIFQAFDSSQSEIFQLRNRKEGTALLRLFPDDTAESLILLADVAKAPLQAAGVADPGRGALLLLRREPVVNVGGGSNEQWVIYVDGRRVYALKAGVAIPADDDEFDLIVGTPTPLLTIGLPPAPGDAPAEAQPLTRFHGKIDMLAVRTPEKLLYAHSGIGFPGLVRRVLPKMTSYLGVGEDVGVRKADLAGINSDNHGIYRKSTYYALSPSDLGRAGSDGVTLTVDWGASYDLVPDLKDPARYVAAHPGEEWAGSVSFEDEESDHRARFVAHDSRSLPTHPWLQDGKKYIAVAGRPEPRWAGETPFDASTAHPNRFFSATACYNILTMDLVDFQKSGCAADRPIFKTSPIGESRDQGGYNVPYGWNYQSAIVSKANSQHAFISNVQELSSAFSGGQSNGYMVLVYGANNNTSAEEEYSRYSRFGRALELEQSFATSSVLIVKPEEIQLADCFILDVMRATATVIANGRPLKSLAASERPHPPEYFDADGARKYCTDAGLDDPLTVQKFVERYGTHYAHATTYGARGFTKKSMLATELKLAVQSRKKRESGSNTELDLKELGGAGKIKITDEKSSGSGSGIENALATEDTVIETYCIGGEGCDGKSASVAQRPVPVYLDLQTFDHLLAPPFFTDAHVLRNLRPLVAAEVARLITENANRPTVPPVMRLIDVQFDSKRCNYHKDALDRDGSLLPQYAFLKDVCAQMDQNTLVGALGINADGTSNLIELKLPHEANVSPELVEDMFNIGMYWAGKPMPSLYAMSRCMDSPDHSCPHQRLYLVLEPTLTTASKATVASLKQSLMLKLFPMTNHGYSVDLTANCSDDCAIRFENMVDSVEGRQRNYINWSSGRVNAPSKRLVPQGLSLKVTDPVVGPTLSGRAATYTANGKEWLSVDLTFRVEEEDLPGVLGFKATKDQAEKPMPKTLADIEPAVRVLFRSNGGYVSTYKVNYVVTQPSAGSATGNRSYTTDSGAVTLGRSWSLRMPNAAKAIRLESYAVGRIGGRPILQLTLDSVSKDICIETYGTVFAPQWRYCN